MPSTRRLKRQGHRRCERAAIQIRQTTSLRATLPVSGVNALCCRHNRAVALLQAESALPTGLTSGGTRVIRIGMPGQARCGRPSCRSARQPLGSSCRSRPSGPLNEARPRKGPMQSINKKCPRPTTPTLQVHRINKSVGPRTQSGHGAPRRPFRCTTASLRKCPPQILRKAGGIQSAGATSNLL